MRVFLLNIYLFFSNFFIKLQTFLRKFYYKESRALRALSFFVRSSQKKERALNAFLNNYYIVNYLIISFFS